jgi:hypothetical protein
VRKATREREQLRHCTQLFVEEEIVRLGYGVFQAGLRRAQLAAFPPLPAAFAAARSRSPPPPLRPPACHSAPVFGGAHAPHGGGCRSPS